ncbi:alpha/beta hydrolase family protein [Hydrocarboniclastica marina]|uniref:Alpha/beta hydrolase n=1 Tax=Hydrocarboniclastica marina TaxID=2259620 RepID=A0A4V1D913_9ALTE|nr:hypothetical protein [Hydrocarboniclastica marina]QCF27090.1 hypothetical protein soil367_14750 [Hydrocarboniclastica marina]
MSLNPARFASLMAAALAACFTGPAVATEPPYPSLSWTLREFQNYNRAFEAPREQLLNPLFLSRWSQQSLENQLEFIGRSADDPSWTLGYSPLLGELLEGLLADPDLMVSLPELLIGQATKTLGDPSHALSLSLNSEVTPLCAAHALPCTGDPFRYPSVDPFYESEAVVEPVVFYDQACARISGRVWRPRERALRQRPAVIIENGSVQAPETVYWWAAQALVRSGYVVMTFDPRGQGRSDFQAPSGGQGSNANPAVFWEGLVNAIDFFRSSPAQPYPHNAACAGAYPTEVTDSNPFHDGIDPDRLGLAGHSLGAIGVTVVQGLGATGADPWPGLLDQLNPVDAVVAWDGAIPPGGGTTAGVSGSIALLNPFVEATSQPELPRFGARVPLMSQSSEYGLAPVPFKEPPDPEARLGAFQGWRAAGVPAYEFTVSGSTHFEWSQLPLFPATSWCPVIMDGQCRGGWGAPVMEYYTVAWFDRWLKQPDEAGFHSADDRLLDDDRYANRFSFYYQSARDFTTRQGDQQECEDIEAGCEPERRRFLGLF